jgi:hypothetical protein
MTDEDNTIVRVVRVEPLSIHDYSLIESAKDILAESINVSRGFCIEMLRISSAAIPAYVAIIALTKPKLDEFCFLSLVIISVSPMLFLIAILLFVLAYRPQLYSIDINDPDDIENMRRVILQNRNRISTCGFIVFCVAVIFSVTIVFFMPRLDGVIRDTLTCEVSGVRLKTS